VVGRRERLLVNRGWVPAGRDRRELPDVAVDSATRIVAGRLERLPRPGLRLGANVASGGRGAETVVLQYPSATELAGHLGEPVQDYQLLLDASAADGYVREWRAPGVAPERNLAYAGQWFALAAGAAAAALVMAFRTVRRRQ
jgi:surfeit locus 1 family protein